MINTLKQDYVQALNLLGAKVGQQKAADTGGQNQQMKQLLSTMLEYGKQK